MSSATWPSSAIQSSGTWSCIGVATRFTRPSPPRCCTRPTRGSSSRQAPRRPPPAAPAPASPPASPSRSSLSSLPPSLQRPVRLVIGPPRRPLAASSASRACPPGRSLLREARLHDDRQPVVLVPVEAHEQALFEVRPQLVFGHLRDELLELVVDVLEGVVEFAPAGEIAGNRLDDRQHVAVELHAGACRRGDDPHG